MKMNFRKIRGMGFTCALALGIITSMVMRSTEAQESPRESEKPLIVYDRIISEIASQDPTPLLRVYADGMMVVHIPVYMKKAGTYEKQLSPAELEQLVNLMTDANLNSLDRAMAQELRAQNAESGQLMAVSDDEFTTIKLDLASNRAAIARDSGLSSSLDSAVQTDFNWMNLQFDASQSSAPALTAAANVERHLLGLVDDITR